MEGVVSGLYQVTYSLCDSLELLLFPLNCSSENTLLAGSVKEVRGHKIEKTRGGSKSPSLVVEILNCFPRYA